MTKHICAALLALALAVAGACGEDAENAEDAARRAAESAEDAAQRAGETAEDAAKDAQGRVEQATQLTATLTGDAEVPRRGDPDGTGTAKVNLDASKGQVCFDVSVQGIDRPVGMHIHEGEAGKAGPVVVALNPTPTSGDGTTTGCVDADRALMSRIGANPGNFYVNVHTAAFPDGALRGQLRQ